MRSASHFRSRGTGILPAAALLFAGCSLPAADPPRPGPGDDVFDPGRIRRFRIEIPEEGVRRLDEERKEYVRGVFREEDESWPDVGIRLKGSAGSARPLWEKSGITVKLDRFEASRRYRGLRKLVLNNAVQDPTFLCDLVGNDLFRAAGVPAPRIGYARVEVNGRDMGLYIIIEAITRDFLGRWFRDASGNLYEGPGDIDDVEGIDADSRGGAADRSDLKVLAEAAAERDPARRLERIGAVLDVDRFMTFAALEMLVWHWDGYVVAKNNFHLYRDPADGRFVFFPHGMDQIFGETGAPVFADPREAGIVGRAVLATAEGRRRYRERLAELLPKVAAGALGARVREIGARLLPEIAGDDAEARKGYEDGVGELASRIAERIRIVREALEGGEPPHHKPLALEDGKARPAGWEVRVGLGEPELARSTREGIDGKAALGVRIQDGEGAASWRTRVLLPSGRYRLSGLVRVKGVEPLGESDGGESVPSGACLRISGKQPEAKLIGQRGWTRLEFEFEVEGSEDVEGEGPAGEVELVCELRASKGAAWFDEESLEIRRLP